MRHFKTTGILILAGILFWVLAPPALAGNKGAMLSPTRVVMEGRTRSAIIKMINPEDRTNTYKVSLISMRMDDYGRRIQVKEPSKAELAVQKMIRFSPRRATVGPKEWQTIRLMARKPADLAPGEYRAHLMVVPVVNAQQLSEADKKDQNKTQTSLEIVVAITIPIIVRHGDGNVEIQAQPPQLKRIPQTGAYSLETELLRQGNHSAYFNAMAYLTPPGREDKQLIGELRGVSFYTPNTRQFLHIPLDEQALSKLAGKGLLTLEFQDLEKPGKPLLGSRLFQLD